MYAFVCPLDKGQVFSEFMQYGQKDFRSFVGGVGLRYGGKFLPFFRGSFYEWGKVIGDLGPKVDA